MVNTEKQNVSIEEVEQILKSEKFKKAFNLLKAINTINAERASTQIIKKDTASSR